MSNESSRECREDIAREILAYLADHPAAQDTLEGIIQWWLLERRIRHQEGLVKEALNVLVRDGFIIECQRRPAAQAVYRVNKEVRCADKAFND